MAFNTDKFSATDFVPRTRNVEVRALSEFFGEDEKPVFVVRSITGDELARVQEEVEKHKAARKALSQMAASASQEVADAVRVLLAGVKNKDSTPDAWVHTLNLVHIALVEPKLEYSQLVRLATFFPVEISLLRNTALELLGMGHDTKKPDTSTPSPA